MSKRRKDGPSHAVMAAVARSLEIEGHDSHADPITVGSPVDLTLPAHLEGVKVNLDDLYQTIARRTGH